jgi:hypothetical protein
LLRALCFAALRNLLRNLRGQLIDNFTDRD